MKYMARGGFDKNGLMRLTLGLTLLLLVGFWLTTAAIYFAKMDLTPASVVHYYRGNEEAFQPPRSYQSMLEVTHGHLAMMALVLLFLTHLVIFVPARYGVKVAFIAATFLSALLGEAAGWLVRFASPVFAVLKVGSFVALELCIGLLILALAAHLWREACQERARRRGRVSGTRAEHLPGDPAVPLGQLREGRPPSGTARTSLRASAGH